MRTQRWGLILRLTVSKGHLGGLAMKSTNRLLLGTAAGLMAASGAQAADMPLKAKPVQYVKICTLYGDGYYYIPGTDTCIKIGGIVQLDVDWNSFASGHRDDRKSVGGPVVHHFRR